MNEVYAVAAFRSAVVPRNGEFSELEVWELAAPVLQKLVMRSGIAKERVDCLVMGNALYGGGNPARMSALAAGFPESLPCMTLDTQCCSGMDAIALAMQRIASGHDNVVIAGGLESWSRSPIRHHRPKEKSESAIPYDRPPFSPIADKDPDLADSITQLADVRNITRQAQEDFAIRSHERALQSVDQLRSEIIEINGVSLDPFTRKLTRKLCLRLPLIAGDKDYGLTSATVAVEADAAAAVILVSKAVLDSLSQDLPVVRLVAAESVGTSTSMPALAPVEAGRKILQRSHLALSELKVVEIMEAYAAQAMTCINDLNIHTEICNPGGGALSRGHPIGASGAVNVVRLFHELGKLPIGGYGLAAIAAAGGLGSALVAQTIRNPVS